MSDLNERLKDKTLQIAQLNQKLEVLQAQLGGSHRRANELGGKVETLTTEITSRDQEIQMLRSEVARFKGALESVGQEMQSIKADQTQVLSRKQPGGDDYSMKQDLIEAHRTIDALREDLKKLSAAASSVLNDESDGIDILRKTVMEIGDPRYRILNLVLERRSVRLDEIAALLVTDMSEAIGIAESLQLDGEVEIKEGQTVIPAKKYREVEAPEEVWKQSTPSEIFDSLEDVVGRTEGAESVVSALEIAAEILEQKMSRGGALMFEMRRTVSSWRKQEGDKEELKYKIREWKGREESFA
ncbi:MAG: hypothetical protein RTV31_15695 [Candidatus Thorarchaeota archaeon]